MVAKVNDEEKTDSMFLYPCKEDCSRCIPIASNQNPVTGIIYYHISNAVSADIVEQLFQGNSYPC
jgi:hypothetical protein